MSLETVCWCVVDATADCTERGSAMLKSWKVPTLSPTAQKARNRRCYLLEQAKGRDNKRARKQLKKEFNARVYTTAEINAFVSGRPELETKEVIGKSVWDMSKPNFTI